MEEAGEAGHHQGASLEASEQAVSVLYKWKCPRAVRNGDLELPSPETQSPGKTPALLPRLERGHLFRSRGWCDRACSTENTASRKFLEESGQGKGCGLWSTFRWNWGVGGGSGGQAWEARPCIHPTALN